MASNTLAVQSNVPDTAAGKALVAKTVERFGEINILILNAGLLAGDKTLETTEEEDYERMFATNVNVFDKDRQIQISHLPAPQCCFCVPHLLFSLVLFPDPLVCKHAFVSPSPLLWQERRKKPRKKKRKTKTKINRSNHAPGRSTTYSLRSTGYVL